MYVLGKFLLQNGFFVHLLSLTLTPDFTETVTRFSFPCLLVKLFLQLMIRELKGKEEMNDWHHL